MRTFTLAVAALVMASQLLAVGAQPRPNVTPKIAYGPGQPKEFAGQICAKGTYSLGGNTALRIVSITLHTSPLGGGQIISDKCKWKDGTWSGAVSGRAPGKYECRTEIVVQDAQGHETTWSTPFVTVDFSGVNPIIA